MDKIITVSSIGDVYKINIKSENPKMSSGYLAGIIIGFLFFLIIGLIMLIVWLVKNTNNETINMDIVISKQNWEEELNKQLLIHNFGSDTDKIKLEISNKIKLLN